MDATNPPPPPPTVVAPFDFAAAEAFKLQRARDLLAAEEARNPAPDDDVDAPPTAATPGASRGLSMEQALYDGVVASLQSAGVRILPGRPTVEAHDGLSLTYVVRGRSGLDLYELKLSSQRHFVLVRTARSVGAFGRTGLRAANRLDAATDVTVPLIGQVYTVMLDLNRYVVRLADDSTALVNEALLLANLNENIYAKYGLVATTVGPTEGAGAYDSVVERMQDWLAEPMNVVALAAGVAVVGVVVLGVLSKRRKA